MTAKTFSVLTFILIWSVQTNIMAQGVDECSSGFNTCPENSVCNDTDVNVNGTVTCTCKPGFSGNETSCKDIDECKLGNPCSRIGAICENTVGSHLCFCDLNYENVSGICKDIDECANNHDCHKDAMCTNLPGSFNCTCKSGYTGHGKVCSDIDECSNNTHNCHASSSCENLSGSYSCNCRVGVETGKTCEVSSYCPSTADPPDKCANSTHDCHKNAMCLNLAGGNYTCKCLDGYMGDGKTCSEEDDDDNDTLIILASITIGLLASCFIAILIAIVLLYRWKNNNC